MGAITHCSDDLLWLDFITLNYLDETADDSILDEKVKFLPDPKTKDLMKAMDALNQRFGRGTLKIASCGVHRRRNNNILEIKNSLQGHQLRKSPAYTTKWADLPVVK